MNRKLTTLNVMTFVFAPLLSCGILISAHAAELDLRLMQTTDLYM